MSTDAEQALVAEAWNQGDAQAAADFYTADSLRVEALDDVQPGRAAHRRQR